VHLEFPRDDAVDLGAQCGWHFLVGSLWDAEGNEYGIEFMLFEQAMYPPAFARELGLSPLDNLVAEVQFAISTRGDRHHQAEPLVTLGTSGLIRTGTAPFSFRVGANSFESLEPDSLMPMRVRSVGVDLGGEQPLPLRCDLVLTGGKAVLEQGDHGAMPSVAGIGTFYYSVPRIDIDPQESSISIDGRQAKTVRGEIWFDHQWGDFEAAKLRWNWFALQLADGADLMIFELFDRQGGPVLRMGTYAKEGKAEGLASSDFATNARGSWKSPSTATVYPMDWTISIPAKGLNLKVDPVIRWSQFNALTTTMNVYWEGAVKVSGSHTGVGFMELSGYQTAREADTGKPKP